MTTQHQEAELAALSYEDLKRHYAYFLFDDVMFSANWFNYQRAIFEQMYKRDKPQEQVTRELKTIEREMQCKIINHSPRQRWACVYRLARLRGHTEKINPYFALDETINARKITFLGNAVINAHKKGIYITPTDCPENRKILARMNFYNVLNTIWQNLPDYRVRWNGEILHQDRTEFTSEGFRLP